MLGGATGAGKSILLQTLVTSLLLANRPDELNLVLVDFKGGSAFLPFAGCPHVVSLIRSTGETAADVFDAAAARAGAGIRAGRGPSAGVAAGPVRRRDRRVLAVAGATCPGWQPLPRLVLVFDEFARVLETSPEFPHRAGERRGQGAFARDAPGAGHAVAAGQALAGAEEQHRPADHVAAERVRRQCRGARGAGRGQPSRAGCAGAG